MIVVCWEEEKACNSVLSKFIRKPTFHARVSKLEKLFLAKQTLGQEKKMLSIKCVRCHSKTG